MPDVGIDLASLTHRMAEQIIGERMKRLRAIVPKNKYVRIGTAALLVFVVILILKGPGAAVFGAAATAVVLFILSFDPRIKRHW